jgi:hypothetical protein
VDDPTDPPLKIDVAEKLASRLILTPHHRSAPYSKEAFEDLKKAELAMCTQGMINENRFFGLQVRCEER